MPYDLIYGRVVEKKGLLKDLILLLLGGGLLAASLRARKK